MHYSSFASLSSFFPPLSSKLSSLEKKPDNSALDFLESSEKQPHPSVKLDDSGAFLIGIALIAAPQRKAIATP